MDQQHQRARELLRHVVLGHYPIPTTSASETQQVRPPVCVLMHLPGDPHACFIWETGLNYAQVINLLWPKVCFLPVQGTCELSSCSLPWCPHFRTQAEGRHCHQVRGERHPPLSSLDTIPWIIPTSSASQDGVLHTCQVLSELGLSFTLRIRKYLNRPALQVS